MHYRLLKARVRLSIVFQEKRHRYLMVFHRTLQSRQSVILLCHDTSCFVDVGKKEQGHSICEAAILLAISRMKGNETVGTPTAKFPCGESTERIFG